MNMNFNYGMAPNDGISNPYGSFSNYGMNFGYNSMNSMLGNMFSGYGMPGMSNYGYGMTPNMGYGNYMGMNGSMSLPIYNYQQGNAWDTTLATSLGRRDPVYLDTNHDGQLNVESGQNVAFDMNGDGVMDKVTEWNTKDAQLVYNKIGDNGQIDGKELMNEMGLNGEQNKYKTGWDKAADVFKADSNGIISGDNLKDARFWTDANGNGKVDDGELKTADELGIQSIDTKNGKFTYKNQIGNMNVNFGMGYGNPYGNQYGGYNPYGNQYGGYNPYGSQGSQYGPWSGIGGGLNYGGFNPYGNQGGLSLNFNMNYGYNPMMSYM